MGPLPDAGPPVTGLRRLDRVLAPPPRLRPDGTARDTAGTRRLFYDQYVGLLRLPFVTPTLTSLRDLQQASGVDAVRRLGLSGRVSRGALSEAAGVVDPALLRGLLTEPARQVAPPARPADREVLRHLTAVGGARLPALPRMAHACGATPDDCRPNRTSSGWPVGCRSMPPSPPPRRPRSPNCGGVTGRASVRDRPRVRLVPPALPLAHPAHLVPGGQAPAPAPCGAGPPL